jgi:hypothetical protein
LRLSVDVAAVLGPWAPAERRLSFGRAAADFVHQPILISLKAGGTALNLTAADTVIHYDPWWNPAAEGHRSANSICAWPAASDGPCGRLPDKSMAHCSSGQF